MKQTVRNEKRMYDGKLPVIKADITLRDEQSDAVHAFEREKVVRGEAVAVLIYEADTESFILVKQYRYPANRFLVEIPAGRMESGETPEKALRREVSEETGYELEGVRLITSFYVSPGYSDERMHLFYAEVSHKDRSGEGGGGVSQDEFTELVRIPREELEDHIISGELVDAKTLMACWWWLGSKV